MQIKLTRHAKNRKRWRKLSDEEIEETLRAPDYVEDENGAKVACKKIGNRQIKVPYVMEDDVCIVLTIKSKISKE